MTGYTRIWLAAVMAVCVFSTAARAFEIEPVMGETGVDAWLVSEDAVPIVAVEVLFHAGSYLDPDGKSGLADMTARLLTEGAGDLDSQAFAARLRDLNVSLSISADRDKIRLRMRTLSEHTDAAFDLVRLALTQPRFDTADVERVRAKVLANLARDDEDPDDVASRTLFADVFAGHRYAASPTGTPQSVSALTAADMRAYVAQAFARDNLSIAVVGDITADELRPLIDATFGGLPAASDRATPRLTEPLTPGVTLVERNNSQTVVMFALDGITRDDEDFIAAYVMNYILGGGGFISRIFREVREERGLVYSARTALVPFAHGGILIGYLASSNATAGQALDVARKQIEDIAADGITAEELDIAKTYLTGSYALRFDSSRSIAGQLALIQYENLGIDYIDERNSLIEAVTLEDVRRVAKRLLKPDALHVVAVGAPDGLGTTNASFE